MREADIAKWMLLLGAIFALYTLRYRLLGFLMSANWLRNIVVRRFAGPYIRKKLEGDLF
ncbi:hypothetical protein [Aureibacillus halotolerans]|uniref:Uncharacterized protein n=1 Tax=Aureibacillus halotolerans TaxID=1508390 RepID=A0A4R6UAH8_9BACI|nr:hypothetical protein [Aureibacillus halotolerans]TDQ41695.1 hypothetical protein EV213_103278 [Aureibacillus halotolerans]